MATTISGFQYKRTPINNVTPFTYRDGMTYLEILESMRQYVNTDLVDQIGELHDGFSEHVNNAIEQMVTDMRDQSDAVSATFGEWTRLWDEFKRYINTEIERIAEPAIREGVNNYINAPGTLNIFRSIFADRITEDTAKRQSQLYATFYTKLRNNEPVSICALGDSTTYGYDMSSGDRVAAPTGVLPDGSIHRHDRTPKPYPAVLQSRLRDMYGPQVTVKNRGFSGDTTKSSYNRWITGHDCGLTLVSLGINDASNGTIDLDTHFEYYEKIILREINEYNSAVVIITPFKNNYHNPSKTIDTYRSAIVSLAVKYGIPVVDAEPWLSGFGMDAYSDSVHMNTKGYEIIGTRLAALFVNDGPLVPFKVSSGTRLSTRPTIDNMLLGEGSHSMAIHTGGGGVREGTGTPTRHISALMKDGTSVYYAFYAEVPDLVIHFTYGIFADNTLTAELDFGIEQPSNIGNAFVGIADAYDVVRADSTVTYTATKAEHRLKLNHETKVLRVASPGWHVLKFTTTGDFPEQMDGLRIYGMDFMGYRDYASTIKASAFHMPVPPAFNGENTPITEFRAHWPKVLTVLGLNDWEKDLYQAPPLKVTIRSWDTAITEYALTINVGGETQTDLRPEIEMFSHLRTIKVREDVDARRIREIDSVSFNRETREVVFKLVTANNKDTLRNFVVDISPL